MKIYSIYKDSVRTSQKTQWWPSQKTNSWCCTE